MLFGDADYEPVPTILFHTNHTDNKKCPGIIISARVHPGETNSSWVMEGLINYLLSDAEYAQVSYNEVLHGFISFHIFH